jgi:DUF438 domain-containing protein
VTEDKKAAVKESVLQFETGSLTKAQLDGLLDTLPVDVTFVNADDTIRYFSKLENASSYAQKP